MIIEQCRDAKLINSIVTHPKIYPHITDDFFPPPEEFNSEAFLNVDGVYILTPKEGDRVYGAFQVVRHTGVLFEMHTCLLPECKVKLDCAKALVSWVFTNTTCRKLFTWAHSKKYYDFVLKAGFVEEGVCQKSFIKNGVLLDQHLMGMGK